MSKVLSAKDKAFEEERIKFRKEINELKLKLLVEQQAKELTLSKCEILEYKLATYKDWLERLLDYCNMSKQELEELLRKEKRRNEIVEQLDIFYKTVFDRRFY